MTTPPESCFFWIDESQPEDERYMSVMCVQCRTTKQPTVGWFWEGEKKGYGPYEIVCDLCGKIIYTPTAR